MEQQGIQNSGWSHRKLFWCPCRFPQFLFGCSIQVGLQCASEFYFDITCIFLKCYILLYIYIYLINHLVDLDQKQYSQLRAVFKVYSKSCFPSLSVDLSQKRLRGTGPMSLIKAETPQLFGECMRGENAWKWKRGMYACVNLASTSRMQSLDKVAYIIHTHLTWKRTADRADKNLSKKQYSI